MRRRNWSTLFLSTCTYFSVISFFLVGFAEADEVGEFVQLRIRSRTEVAGVRSVVRQTVLGGFRSQSSAKGFSEADDLCRRNHRAVQDAVARLRARDVGSLCWHFFLCCWAPRRAVVGFYSSSWQSRGLPRGQLGKLSPRPRRQGPVRASAW